MARIFYVHGKSEEALDAIRQLRASGHVVRCHADCGPQSCSLLAEWAPDLLIISLRNQPTDGPHWTSLVQVAGGLAGVPMVFTGGPAVVVHQAREAFPRAVFCPTRDIPARAAGFARRPEVQSAPPAAMVNAG